MNKKVVSIRMNEKAITQLNNIAKKENMTLAEVIETALDYYNEYLIHKTHASVISDEVLSAVNATIDGLEQRINNKSNQLLSSCAIGLYVISRILADNLEVRSEDFVDYISQAKSSLSTVNRIIKVSEVV